MSGTLWDAAVIGLVVAAGVRGVWRGGFRELASLAGMLTGVLVGWSLADALAAEEGRIGGGTVTAMQQTAAFVAVLVGLWGLGGLIGWLFERTLSTSWARATSAVLGLAAGGAKGLAVAGTVLVFLYLLVPQLRPVIHQSTVAEPVMKAALAAGSALIGSARGAG